MDKAVYLAKRLSIHDQPQPGVSHDQALAAGHIAQHQYVYSSMSTSNGAAKLVPVLQIMWLSKLPS